MLGKAILGGWVSWLWAGVVWVVSISIQMSNPPTLKWVQVGRESSVQAVQAQSIWGVGWYKLEARQDKVAAVAGIQSKQSPGWGKLVCWAQCRTGSSSWAPVSHPVVMVLSGNGIYASRASGRLGKNHT